MRYSKLSQHILSSASNAPAYIINLGLQVHNQLQEITVSASNMSLSSLSGERPEPNTAVQSGTWFDNNNLDELFKARQASAKSRQAS